MEVQHLQNIVFSFEKGQIHSYSGSNHQIKKIPPSKFPILPSTGEPNIYTPYPLMLYGKPCKLMFQDVL